MSTAPVPTKPAETGLASPAGEPQTVDVLVVGGGLAGSAAAATAARHGARVALVVGPAGTGRARTDVVQGFSLNRGPHALYRRGAGARVLAELGIEPDGVAPPTRSALAVDGGLVPLGRAVLGTSLLGRGDRLAVVRFAAQVARTEPSELADRTTSEWLDASLPPAAARLVRTGVRVATYTADLDAQSADVAATQLRAASRGVLYLHGGWRQLTDSLAAAGPTAERHEDVVVAIHPDGDASFVRGRRSSWRATTVVVALGSARAAAELLGEAPPGWPVEAPGVHAACLDLGLRTAPAVAGLVGVDEPTYAVTHCPRARLAPRGRAVVHAARYLAADEHVTPDEARAALRRVVRRLGVDHDDIVAERYLHRMAIVSLLPTPALGGLAGRPDPGATGRAGVLVAGDWVGREGFLADASLASGAEAGLRAAERVRRRPQRAAR